MENKTTIDGIKFIMGLFQQKRNELKDRLENLCVTDVKEDNIFLRTKEAIRNQIILHPVTFQDPVILGHRSEIITDQPNYINPFGGQRRITVVEVQFPFTGSSELFYYRPDSVRYSDPTVYLPDGNTVTVNVLTEQLDKAKVLLSAQQQFGLTKSIINDINSQIVQWGKQIDQEIEQTLGEKRKLLLEFYG